MGRAGLEHVRRAFTWRRIGSDVSSTLMALCEARSGRRTRTAVDRGTHAPSRATSLGTNLGTNLATNVPSNLGLGG